MRLRVAVAAALLAVSVAASAPKQDQVPTPAGPPVDRSAFRVSRALQKSAPGLVVLPLDVDVIAVSRNLADVRVLDNAGHQVPYIVEFGGQPLALTLPIGARESNPAGESRYRMALPYRTFPQNTRLVLSTSARVFERTVRLLRSADEQRSRGESELTRAEWRNTDPAAAAPPLEFDVPLYGVKTIELAIAEGDNAPLPITSAQLLVPAAALRFYHPGGALSIVYGNDKVAAPRYDLALLSDRVLREPARTIRIAKRARAAEPSQTSEMKYFWIVIAVAAIALLAVLARLIAPQLREETRPLG